MKISYNWLKDYIDIDTIPEKLSQILTDIGLEVEGVELFQEVKGGLKGLVIGEVLTCEKHIDADKLSCATVHIGTDEPLRIVCGAPNIATGQKVVVATVGSELYMNDKSFRIKKTKIRGELSEGMICAEDEIGLGENHEGIMVLEADAIPGTPAAKYFKLTDDTVFEIGLTPNRIDAASHFGTARDLAAFFNQQAKVNLMKPDTSAFAIDNTDLNIEIEIEDTEGCRRFTGLTISDISVSESPKWIQNRLKAIGLSPINNVVDVTNFVLHELGQPLHAYDADKIQGGKIIVKRLKDGTGFTTLDDTNRTLSDQDVMVCDSENPLCIAGVFGGADSGVTSATKNIFLESAYFDPVAVRKTAKRHGLTTDSSFRFERGVDPENTLTALKRAAQLIKNLAGGQISSDIQDVYPCPIVGPEIEMLYSHIDRLIGKRIERDRIRNILRSLDIELLREEGDALRVKIPPYRVDVTREADVIEEILRIYGYNNVEFSDKLNSSVSYLSKPDNESLVNSLSDYLSHNGFNEIMSNSLTKSAYYTELTSYPKEKLVTVLNPLSNDLNVMRQTLLFGGLEAIARNINHKNPDLRLYEYGRVYSLEENDKSKNENYCEIPSFGLFITGQKEPQSWAVGESSVTFYQLKAYYLNLLKKAGINTQNLKTTSLEQYSDLFSGGLEYFSDKQSVIRAGVVKQDILELFDLPTEVYFAEVSWGKLIKLAEGKKYFRELPRFPEVRRDLALLLDENIEYTRIEQIAFSAEKKLLKRVNLFDYYKGKNIPQGKKSYAVSFFLQDLNKTLTDKEIDRIMSRITKAYVNEIHAELR